MIYLFFINIIGNDITLIYYIINWKSEEYICWYEWSLN